MTRLMFPDEGSRLVYRVNRTAMLLAPGAAAPMYRTAEATVAADLLVYDGTPTPGAVIPGAELTLDQYSRLPLFWGPDEVDTLWTVIEGGPVAPVYARTDDRLDSIADAVAAAEAAGVPPGGTIGQFLGPTGWATPPGGGGGVALDVDGVPYVTI